MKVLDFGDVGLIAEIIGNRHRVCVFEHGNLEHIFECDLGFGWAFRMGMSHVRYFHRQARGAA